MAEMSIKRAARQGRVGKAERGIRSTSPAVRLCGIVDRLCDAGEISSAKKTIEEFLTKRDDAVVWKKYAYVLLRTGEPIAARAAMRNVVLRRNDSHIVDL